MSMRAVCVVGCLFVTSGFVMLCGLLMMTSGMSVVLRCSSMMLGCLF